MLLAKQISISDSYDDCLYIFENDKPEFLRLLEENINMDELIPASVKASCYSRTGRPHDYLLTSYIWAFFIQQLLGIPTTTLLITILKSSKELRELCGLIKSLILQSSLGSNKITLKNLITSFITLLI